MKVRFFSAFEPPFSFYRDLLPYLVKNGIDVELVISRSEYRKGRNDIESDLEKEGINLTIMPTIRSGNKSLNRIFTYVTYYLFASLYSLFSEQYDLNFFLSQPPFYSLWGYILRFVRRQKYCILVMDLHPHIAINAGILNRNTFITNFLLFISRFILTKADKIFVLGRCMKEVILQEGVEERKISLIRNWSNSNIHRIPSKDNLYRKDLGLSGKFIIQYAGNMGVSHYFKDLLQIAKELRGEKDIRFVFIGNGSKVDRIKKVKYDNDLENIILLSFQPENMLSQSLSMGDIHFVSLDSGFEGYLVPSKAYSALAVGKPIIYQGNKNGEIARMIIEENIGVVIPVNKPVGLKKAIMHYYRNPELIKEQRHRINQVVARNYNMRNSLEKYYFEINQLES